MPLVYAVRRPIVAAAAFQAALQVKGESSSAEAPAEIQRQPGLAAPHGGMRHAASGQVHHCVLADGASPNPPQVDNC